MIVSHKHKFIFFAVPKTATHAVREALRAHLGPDDWEQQMLFGKDVSPIPQIAALRHGHISVQQIKPFIGPDAWDDYFKFAFVRNPYDRYISTFFFLTRDQQLQGQDESALLKQAIQNPRFTSRLLVEPQSKMLLNPDGSLGIDFLAKYETIQEDFDRICERIGIPSKVLIEKNASEHKTSDSYYDGELRRLVSDFYQPDFDLLGYDRIEA